MRANTPAMGDHACPLCIEAKEKDGAVCVFDNAEAAADCSTSNRCMTLLALRHMVRAWAEDKILACGDDENVLVLPFRGPRPHSGALAGVLQWYKRRGRTQVAITITEHGPRPMTLKEAQALIADLRIVSGQY